MSPFGWKIYVSRKYIISQGKYCAKAFLQKGVNMRKKDEQKYIYRPYITVKGKKIYARNYGKKAFKIPVD